MRKGSQKVTLWRWDGKVAKWIKKKVHKPCVRFRYVYMLGARDHHGRLVPYRKEPAQ